MKKMHFVYGLALSLIFLSCEKEKTNNDIIDFEDFPLPEAGYWNGSDNSGGFLSGNGFFSNSFNTEYQFWHGFSVSNHTDVVTPGYLNQYSAIAGTGDDNSEKYAVLYSLYSDTISFNPTC
jgi:hypothetical protein